MPGFDYASPDIVVLVTANARSGALLFTDPNLNQSVIRTFLDERDRLGHSIIAYCLMPNHHHLVCGPRQSAIPITQLIGGINSQITRLLWDHGHSGKLMQRSFYDHVVRKQENLKDIVEYVLANPVRWGLATDPDEYPYSGMVDPLPI